MTQTLTIVRRHGSSKWEVAVGPGNPHRVHRAYLRVKRRAKEDPEFCELMVCEEVRRIKMDKPKQAKPPARVESGKPAKPPLFQPPQPVPAKKPAARSLFASRLRTQKAT